MEDEIIPGLIPFIHLDVDPKVEITISTQREEERNEGDRISNRYS